MTGLILFVCGVGGLSVGLVNYGHVALAGEQQEVEFDTADGE